jgi:ParB-like chromosome segregation protein Spo0J
MSLQQHPLSAAFPAMSAEDFEALTDSIQNIGVQNPITIYEGMVIDGWHRYRAATELGMACPTVDLGDVDPRDFVLAQNKARRHITQAQLGQAVVSVYAWHPAHRAAKEGGTECHLPKTNAELAALAGVGERTIRQAKAVQSKAAPEVVAAVKSGEIGLPKAAAIANLPQAEQAAAIHKPAPKPAKPEPPPIQAPPAAPEAPDEYTELDAARDQISELQIEVARLSDRLAVECYDVSEDEKTEASRIIAELRAEVQSLNAQLAAVTLSRDTYMEENAQMKAQMKAQRREIDKLKSSN